MTTPESPAQRPTGIPTDPAELAALAGRLWAQSEPAGLAPSGPPAAPVAPRGAVPDATATQAATALAPTPPAPTTVTIPEASLVPETVVSPGPDTPPQTSPVAPRGSAPGSSAVLAPAGFGPAIPALTLSAPSVFSPVPVPVAPSPASPGVSVAPASVPRAWSPGDPVAIGDLGPALRPWQAPGSLAPGAHPDLAHPAPGAGADRIDDAPAEAFDVTAIRADFPILAERVNGHPLIWFDNAATTQKPRAVIDRLSRFYEHENSNIHRAAHTLAARATDAYEDARDTVRDFLGAAKSEEIVFVRGATEAINLIAHSWGRKNLGPGDEIVITQLEHHANIVPWQMVARATGAVLTVAPVDDAGNLLLGELADLIGPRTKLVAATAVANAIGTVTPVEEIVSLAHRAGARVLIDGAQSVPHLPTDLTELGADFFVFSGHKVYGPTGIGALYLAERIWEETPAWQGGGNMIADVTIERSIYAPPPNRYEAGTGNIADAVGLAAALRYVRRVGLDRIAAYEHDLLSYATPRLAAIRGVRLVGTADHNASVLSFVLAGNDPEEVGTALNQRGIAVRAGHHCAQPILRRLGLEKTVRPSFAFYNTTEEIDVFLQAVTDLSDGSISA